MTSPSAILSRAADLIRDTATAWEAANARTRNYSWLELTGFTTDDDRDEPLNSAQRWMRLMSPELATAFEETLRAATGMWRLYENRGWSPEKVTAHVSAEARAAMALARAVLGEKEEQ